MNNGEVDVIRRLLKGYKDSLPKLTILIMGPAKSNTAEYAQRCYEKRCQIKDFLIKAKHKAVFPEEVYEEAKTKGESVSNITAFERNLVDQSDQVIILLIPNAQGVESEVNRFSHIRECASKIYLFYDYTITIPWYVKDSIGLIEGNNGKTEKFCRDDLEKCSLLAKIGVRIDQIVSAIMMYPYKKYEGLE